MSSLTNHIIINCNCINFKDFKMYEIKNNPFIVRKLNLINKMNW